MVNKIIHTSSCWGISCGVPQGSVLGPKRFIMHINDICNVSKTVTLVLFADDTNILGGGGAFAGAWK